MNESVQNNLVGELVTEMQRTNPPHVFNVDNNGNASGSSQGQFQQGGINGAMPNGGQNQNQNQNPVNPQLQQQFMIVLQQSPQLMQMFQNPQNLQQALQNPQLMMNIIAQYQQLQSQSQMPQPNPNQIAMEQIQQQMAVDDPDEEEEEDDDVNPDQMLNLQGPVQYDEEIGDVNIPQPQNVNKGFTEKLMEDLKGPLIATLIFLILTQPTIKDFLITSIPKIQDSVLLQTIAFASIFLTLNYLSKKLLEMFQS